MLRAKGGKSGWQGASLVAITYVYFLIFAQFAFLKRLTSLGVADAHLKAVMAAMAAGGVLLSLLAPRLRLWPSPNLRLRLGLVASGTAALLALLPLGFPAAIAVAFLIGAGLGLLTVTLVTHLRRWTGDRNPLLAVGVGTGVGYLVCNLPSFFTASPEVQALSAGILCLAGIGVTLLPALAQLETLVSGSRPAIPFYRVLAGFTALVWLDSAAFFIIQNTPALKAGTWQGTIHLWANGLLHLAAALASAWLLRRKGLSPVLTVSVVALGVACLLLLDPERALLASFFYPIGVSLYSVALVAYPTLLAPAASTAERGRIAGWIYAIAGWTGSAMGIGMAQNLGHVPRAFVAAAGAAVLLPPLFPLLRQRIRELALTVLVLLSAYFLHRLLHATDASPQLSAVERGRQVYISEGCIHCHSQYVRPNSPDVLMWGPVESIQELREESPPLIGNRRQGPDLSEVGGRRSPLWLRAHFYDPAQVSGSSIMPSYSFLFRDERGNDLVAYLESLHGAGTAQHLADERQWQPSATAFARANAARGDQLYRQDCATCHSADGPTRRAWSSSFKRLPPDLATGPYFYLPPSGPAQQRLIRLAQIAKFGIPGTDMPGHEYLPDADIASISLWLSQVTAQSNQ
ncbi:MAG TPA: cbb3-type cytochrome c oxidase subunit II [Terracidiphilus sp.]|nr:cbb3-type cytochrome c oxidase subunit II [Terracidiphilus sp.]